MCLMIVIDMDVSMCLLVWHIIGKMRQSDLPKTPKCLTLKLMVSGGTSLTFISAQTMILCIKSLQFVLPPWNCICLFVWSRSNGNTDQKIMKCWVVLTQGELVRKHLAYHTFFRLILGTESVRSMLFKRGGALARRKLCVSPWVQKSLLQLFTWQELMVQGRSHFWNNLSIFLITSHTFLPVPCDLLSQGLAIQIMVLTLIMMMIPDNGPPDFHTKLLSFVYLCCLVCWHGILSQGLFLSCSNDTFQWWKVCKGWLIFHTPTPS